jgi:hypothetical protein
VVVTPGIGSRPLDAIRREIRGAALRDALPTDLYQLPLGDRAAVYNVAVQAADRAVAAFERLCREERERLARVHLEPR